MPLTPSLSHEERGNLVAEVFVNACVCCERECGIFSPCHGYDHARGHVYARRARGLALRHDGADCAHGYARAHEREEHTQGQEYRAVSGPPRLSPFCHRTHSPAPEHGQQTAAPTARPCGTRAESVDSACRAGVGHGKIARQGLLPRRGGRFHQRRWQKRTPHAALVYHTPDTAFSSRPH